MPARTPDDVVEQWRAARDAGVEDFDIAQRWGVSPSTVIRRLADLDARTNGSRPPRQPTGWERLRTLVEAAVPGSYLGTAEELAAHTGLAAGSVWKRMRSLAAANLVVAAHGGGGGYWRAVQGFTPAQVQTRYELHELADEIDTHLDALTRAELRAIAAQLRVIGDRPAAGQSPVRVTDQMVTAWRAELEAGASVREVADRWQVARETVQRHVGPTGRVSGRRIDPAVVDEWRTAIAAGASVQDIADKWGVSKSAVQRHLGPQGVPPGPAPDPQVTVDDAVAAFERTGTILGAARDLGVGEMKIRTRLWKAGILPHHPVDRDRER
ncbi:helix-turn-helix domain-containing protein [Williamsia sterculiae]|uniref:Uncharacterized protein n=1 Tax=Williamsia sterculiae TaxID=1344003 RepID=A0A1N7HDX4_9NOCA|nr:hypothetical protein [Williamsia sterculiae]SIS23065.1 hypothetical protein SAMN05445060_4044 [Williamsia sterculiae]